MVAPLDWESQLRERIDILNRCGGNKSKAAEACNMSYSAFRESLRQAARLGLLPSPASPQDVAAPGFRVANTSAQFDADGKLQKQWIGTKPDSGEVFEPLPGHVVKGESALLDPDGRVLAKWVKTKEGAGVNLIDAISESFSKFAGSSPAIQAPAVANDDLMTFYPLPDLHFGMLAWGKETGADYDLKIAAGIVRSSIETLVAQSPPSKRAVILVLGDFFHMNDQKNVTPGSGHQLDVDGRFPLIYQAGVELLLDIVSTAAAKHERVELRILRGNHDEDAAVTLRVTMGLFFRNNERISISLDPSVAAYWHHGKCLIGATHGDTMAKFEVMVGAMAVDRAPEWGATVWRYHYSGHIHHRTAAEVMGVECESFGTPAARDAYAARHGYRSGRVMHAITHHKELGELSRHRVNIRGAA